MESFVSQRIRLYIYQQMMIVLKNSFYYFALELLQLVKINDTAGRDY